MRGAEHYILSYYPKGDEGAIKDVQVENTKNSYLLKGLRPGVTYIVQVYAIIRGINSESDEIVAMTGKSNCLNTTNIFVMYMESFVKWLCHSSKQAAALVLTLRPDVTKLLEFNENPKTEKDLQSFVLLVPKKFVCRSTVELRKKFFGVFVFA